jgi:predicted metal-dependent hydrolase
VNPGEPVPVDPAWPRYSDRAFPPYRFVPGRGPHPRRDPKGHSYGKPETPPPRVPPERWRENAEYLHGIDLYNQAYWWECHEVLEGLWHLTGHRGREAELLQGVIQAAAANLRRHLGSEDGARRLATEAASRLESVGDPFMGLDARGFAEALKRYHVLGTASAPPLLRLEI